MLDLIISGGFNVYPKEIESEIDAIDGVVESAVIGVPHPDFGEGVTAIVVTRSGARLDEAAILSALADRLAKYKQPKRVLFAAELPRNAMGKVQKNLLRLKPETDYCDAALVEPLACVVQGIEDTQLRSGQRVLVIGAGPIGLMFVALARHLGCHVTVAGRGKKRLETARRLGAELVVNASEKSGLAASIPPGSIFDVVIEAVGKPETWEAAVRLVRKGGTVNFFGGCPSGTAVSLDTALIHYSNLTLLASFHHTPRTVRRALEFIEAGVVRADDFVDGLGQPGRKDAGAGSRVSPRPRSIDPVCGSGGAGLLRRH